MLTKVRQFFGFVVPGILKPLRVLWNEVIGFVFLSIGIIFGFQGFRRYRQATEEGEAIFVLILTGLFALMMLWFGVTSFLRARKISRS